MDKDRDKLGRFIHGHTPIPHRDINTGRFIKQSKEVDVDRYITTRIEVDRFLRGKDV